MPEACANLVPMQQWIKEPDPAVCRPCLLGPITQWYRDTLEENEGTKELGRALTSLTESPEITPEALCEHFDQLKAAVPPEVRERLLEFDCSIQNYIQEGED